MELHPDVNPDPYATEQFKALNTAYEVLKNPARRALYDRMMRAAEYAPASQPRPAVNPQQQFAMAIREITAVMRTGIFWAMIAFATFVSGMAIYQGGIEGVPANLVFTAGTLFVARILYFRAVAAAEMPPASGDDQIPLATAALLLLSAAVVGAIGIIVALHSVVVLLDQVIPGLAEKVMFSFPVMLAISTIWVIINVLRKEKPLGIELAGQQPRRER